MDDLITFRNYLTISRDDLIIFTDNIITFRDDLVIFRVNLIIFKKDLTNVDLKTKHLTLHCSNTSD